MFIRRIQQTMRRHALLARGQRVLAAVSGGADSVALLAVLRALAPAWRLRLTVAHLDHGLRGAASAADAAFVAALARRWKIPCVLGRADVRRAARRRGVSLEMAGRRARYAFFARAARRHGCGLVATAHTADDQAETMLLNLARGAGLAGLAGIPYAGRHGALRVVRPLRDTGRAEIVAWLRRRRLPWREDASNADPAFPRNRVRREVLPFLEARLNPGIRRALRRTGDILAGDHAWLCALADGLLARCRSPAGGLDRDLLGAAPLAARRRVLRRWLETAGAASEILGFEAIERLDALLTSARPARAVALPGGWTVRRTGALLVLEVPRGAPGARPGLSAEVPAQRLPVPGTTPWPRLDARLRAWIGPGVVRERPAGPGALPARASLALSVWRRRRLEVRGWRPGDRMRPFGMAGTKKVQDIFGDAKVPRARRGAIPLVTCGGEVVWIPGYRVARDWIVPPGARRALQLGIEAAGTPRPTSRKAAQTREAPVGRRGWRKRDCWITRRQRMRSMPHRSHCSLGHFPLRRTPALRVLLPAVLFAAALSGRAALVLPPVIGPHMVLQSGMAVPVWGRAAPGAVIVVRFRGQEKQATAGADGRWRVDLEALEPGGPDTMTISGDGEQALEDVLVGEVWLGSGQSNMAGTSDYYARPDRTANAPRDPGLPRLLEAAPYPRVRLIRAGWPGWRPATRESLEAFSALMTGFGLPLHAALDRPVGLLVGAVGGTPSGFWVPEEDYRADAACKAVAAAFAATTDLDAARKRYQTALALWEQEDAAAKAAGKKMGRGRPLPPQPAGECHEPIGHLFERQLRPFVPFAIRGVLWDQGEGGTAIAGVDQYTLMGALIRGWRRIWGQGEFPFLYVQKPSGGGCAWDPVDPVTCRAEPFAPLPPAPPHARGGLYQELHIRIMEYPRTTMVTASDLGSGTHPDNKSGYGARAARVALGAVYGRPEEWSGPRYADHRVEGGAVHVRFKHTGKGLAWRHGDRLQGFAVAGADRVFRWADAVITGDTVAVSSPAVPQPVAVRYAWDKTHPWANLFNRDGLPALTFRTDEW